jgi:hypothetical protein
MSPWLLTNASNSQDTWYVCKGVASPAESKSEGGGYGDLSGVALTAEREKVGSSCDKWEKPLAEYATKLLTAQLTEEGGAGF